MNFRDTVLGLLQPKPKTPLCLMAHTIVGDSIVEMSVAPALRAEGLQFFDRSISGDTAANAWRRFAYEPRMGGTVVLELGTNDLTAGTNPVPYLEKMAKYAIAEGRNVVFTGIPPRVSAGAYDWNQANIDIMNLAIRLGKRHAGWHMVPYSGTDGLHPDAVMTVQLVASLKGVL